MEEKKKITLQGKWPFLVALAVVFIADLWTKDLAFGLELKSAMHPRVHWLCGEWLGLTKTLNPGAVWGLGGEFTGILVLVRIAVLVGIFVFTMFLPAGRRLAVIALGLISGGALGNLYDNFCNRAGGFVWSPGDFFGNPGPGKVRDFIHVDLGFPPCNPWPDFNVADAMILTGVAMLFLFLPFTQKCGKAKSDKEKGKSENKIESSQVRQ